MYKLLLLVLLALKFKKIVPDALGEKLLKTALVLGLLTSIFQVYVSEIPTNSFQLFNAEWQFKSNDAFIREPSIDKIQQPEPITSQNLDTSVSEQINAQKTNINNALSRFTINFTI